MIVNINPILKKELQYIVILVINSTAKGIPTVFAYGMSKLMDQRQILVSLTA